MYLEGEVRISAPSSRYSTRRGVWVLVNTEFTDDQKDEIAEELALWRPPGLLRELGLRRARPIVKVSDGRPGNLRLTFRSVHSQTRTARSIRSQKELAQIIADTLGWDGFRFKHNATTGSQDVTREFSATRVCGGAPWEWQEITPAPRPPKLSSASRRSS